MDPELRRSRGETANHLRLKRMALLWAQANGYSACALEVSLPRCRYRADLAAYRPQPHNTTAIFECKQARSDLQRDNCCTESARLRLDSLARRRQILETNLRIHYPQLRIADSLFAEFYSHDFAAIGHRGYNRVIRELQALQQRMDSCVKFETLRRYRCANLFFLVLPNDLYRAGDVPPGWGALVERSDGLQLMRKPDWVETSAESAVDFLVRIARAGTRLLNRAQQISFEEITAESSRALSTVG